MIGARIAVAVPVKRRKSVLPQRAGPVPRATVPATPGIESVPVSTDQLVPPRSPTRSVVRAPRKLAISSSAAGIWQAATGGASGGGGAVSGGGGAASGGGLVG